MRKLFFAGAAGFATALGVSGCMYFVGAFGWWSVSPAAWDASSRGMIGILMLAGPAAGVAVAVAKAGRK